MPPNQSGPSPWLSLAATVILSVGGGAISSAFMAGNKDSDLRHVQEVQATHERRLTALEDYRGDMREVMAGLKTEMKGLRDDMADMKALLRSWTGAPKK